MIAHEYAETNYMYNVASKQIEAGFWFQKDLNGLYMF